MYAYVTKLTRFHFSDSQDGQMINWLSCSKTSYYVDIVSLPVCVSVPHTIKPHTYTTGCGALYGKYASFDTAQSAPPTMWACYALVLDPC